MTAHDAAESRPTDTETRVAEVVARAADMLHRYECEHLDSDEAVCPGPTLWDRERAEATLAAAGLLVAPEQPETTTTVEWGVQKRAYRLGEGFRRYGDDEQGARWAASRVIGSGAYVIRREHHHTVGPWTPVTDDGEGADRG